MEQQPPTPIATAPAPRAERPAAAGRQAPAAPAETPGRAVLLSLVLIPLNGYWIIQMERVRQGPYVTSISLFANVVFILLLFVAINVPLRRWQPGWALRRGELLLLYVMLSISSGICGM